MSKSRAARCVVICLAGVLVATSALGCYRRVTRAKGLGAEELAPEISEPQTTFTQDLRNAVTGQDKKKNRD